MKRLLEDAIPDSTEIRSVSASTLTGNLLIVFDPLLPLGTVVARLERLVTRPPGGQDDAAQSPAPAWHARAASAVLAALETGPEGLSADTARRRLAAHGPNRLPEAAGRPRMEILLEQFQNLPTALLAAAAALSLVTGGLIDAAVILGVVALNAAIGFATQSNSERIIGALRLPGQRSCRVRRDGAVIAAPVPSIVPGDLLALQPGAVIAADARVIASDVLVVDESMLTGESLPVAKTTAALSRDRHLSERTNMAFRGTTVVGGSGLAAVVATGAATEAGRIQRLVGEAQAPETPIQHQLGQLGRQLVALSAAVCAGLFVIGLLRGRGVLAMLKSSVALAVAALPEGLPTVATTALALGIEEMRRRRILVRRLDAIETLAAVDVIGFDKTGTLTENRMAASVIVCNGERIAAAEQHKAVPGSPLAQLLEIAALCNEATIGMAGGTAMAELGGTPTETALLRLAIDAGIAVDALRRRLPLERVAYRSRGRRYMVTAHRRGSRRFLLAIKGSPEQVLARCGFERRRGRRMRLSRAARDAIRHDNRQLAESGLRVLGFGEAEAATAAAGTAKRFTWLGLVGLADPERRGVDALIGRLDRAGIRVIMLTGDQEATAAAVARRLNLANGAPHEAIDSAALRADEQASGGLIDRARVFARVTPAEKLQIVRSLQRIGRTVAMTGDGINDSPALRAANVGIAMGRSGSDAAREVADIVLEGDDLATLVTALERGRTTCDNIRKAIHFLLATNLSEILLMGTAMAMGIAAPLTPIQLLWVNLLSDVFPALGLALEPAARDVLEQSPRDPKAPILHRAEMAVLAREGAVIGAGGLAAYLAGLMRDGAAGKAGTMAFTSLVGAQLLHALSCRSPRSIFGAGERLPPNRPLAAALAASGALQVGTLLLPPLRRFMGLTPLGPVDWAITALCAAFPYLVNEAAKMMPKRADEVFPRPRGEAI